MEQALEQLNRCALLLVWGPAASEQFIWTGVQDLRCGSNSLRFNGE